MTLGLLNAQATEASKPDLMPTASITNMLRRSDPQKISVKVIWMVQQSTSSYVPQPWGTQTLGAAMQCLTKVPAVQKVPQYAIDAVEGDPLEEMAQQHSSAGILVNKAGEG